MYIYTIMTESDLIINLKSKERSMGLVIELIEISFIFIRTLNLSIKTVSLHPFDLLVYFKL